VGGKKRTVLNSAGNAAKSTILSNVISNLKTTSRLSSEKE